MTDVERYAHHVRYDADELWRALVREQFWDELSLGPIDKAIAALEYATKKAKDAKSRIQQTRERVNVVQES